MHGGFSRGGGGGGWILIDFYGILGLLGRIAVQGQVRVRGRASQGELDLDLTHKALTRREGDHAATMGMGTAMDMHVEGVFGKGGIRDRIGSARGLTRDSVNEGFQVGWVFRLVRF